MGGDGAVGDGAVGDGAVGDGAVGGDSAVGGGSGLTVDIANDDDERHGGGQGGDGGEGGEEAPSHAAYGPAPVEQ